MFTQGVVAIFGDVVTLIGIMIVLVIMDVRLAIVTLASVPLLVVATLQFRIQIRGAYRDIRLALAKINSYLQESLSGMAVIKALRREKRNEEEFATLATGHRDAFLRSVKAFSVYYPMVEIIEALAIALVLWYGGGRILQDHLSFGALVAFIQYAGRFFRPIRDLSEKYNVLQDAMASSERIFKLLDETPETEPATSAPFNPRGTIRFEDVHFSYDGKTPVLRGATFEVPAGKTTAVVGSTGAGKTTLVGLLARFYTPQSGRITIDGVDVASITRHELRTHLAIVQQDVFLFSGSIDENIRLGENIPDERMQSAVRMSHTDHLLGRLPEGLSTPVGERGSSLSTGERQLIAFARALAFDPTILILDEATASIDSETEALIQDALGALIENRTAIVIAHRLSTIRTADQILVLHHGRVAERGTHEELLELGGIYARLYRLQFQIPGEEDRMSQTGTITAG
jgi:ABC-type multidrug transport system fused ATPase/permease subunit